MFLKLWPHACTTVYGFVFGGWILSGQMWLSRVVVVGVVPNTVGGCETPLPKHHWVISRLWQDLGGNCMGGWLTDCRDHSAHLILPQQCDTDACALTHTHTWVCTHTHKSTQWGSHKYFSSDMNDCTIIVLGEADSSPQELHSTDN